MPQQLKYIGQLAMDNYYLNYQGEDDFFDLEDFTTMVGNTIAGMYLTFYQQQYQMLRQEKKEEVITFDSGWLMEQDLDVSVDKDTKSIYAILEKPVMSFPYDKSSTGIQNIFITDPFSSEELERVSLSSIWQLKYIPKTNVIFFCPDVSPTTCDGGYAKITFIKKGDCNIKKVRVLYVPSLNDGEAYVSDGVIGDAIIKTVMAMRQMESGQVIDQTNDGNSNKIMQSEIDKNTLSGK